MAIRKPAVAGQFYPDSRQQCLAEIAECLPKGTVKAQLPAHITAGIVPHAGWVFSGDLAALVFQSIKQVNKEVNTFVLFGAAHSCYETCPVIFPEGAWETPLGKIDIDEPLTQELIALGAKPDFQSHRQEHSIEVQIPFIQYLFPNTAIAAIIMPPSANRYECAFGQKVGKLVKDYNKKIVCIASTDLTHYGPRYGFSPQGTGPAGIRWAHQTNDLDFIDKALKMDTEHLVESSIHHENACGPAAAGVVVAAAKAAGCPKGYLLAHTNSAEIMKVKFQQSSTESVGYAAIVF
jgi:AmmeMemoRadiSam system protein B